MNGEDYQGQAQGSGSYPALGEKMAAKTNDKEKHYRALRGVSCRLNLEQGKRGYDQWWEAKEGDLLDGAPVHIDIDGLLAVEAIEEVQDNG